MTICPVKSVVPKTCFLTIRLNLYYLIQAQLTLVHLRVFAYVKVHFLQILNSSGYVIQTERCRNWNFSSTEL